MKKLMLTTALVAVTSMGAIAQTASTEMMTDAETAQGDRTVPGFLASDFTGKSLYTLDIDATRELSDQQMTEDQSEWDRIRMRWDSSDLFTASRDQWADVGNIDDVILSQDGEIRGVLIDVGGFLGIGARTVMVDIDELYFVADDEGAEGVDDFFVVAAMTEEQLEGLPEWTDDRLQTGFPARGFDESAAQTDASMGQQEAADMNASEAEAETDTAARSEHVPEGYIVVAVEDLSTDQLMGADVYGHEGEPIATVGSQETEQIAVVEDLVIGADGEVTHVVMDVGGFLGMQSHTVALEIDNVDILWNEENDSVRIQVTMTQQELESLPEHDG